MRNEGSLKVVRTAKQILVGAAVFFFGLNCLSDKVNKRSTSEDNETQRNPKF
jgi:hypothetical protein